MAWITPTSDDVLSEFTPTEQETINSLVADDTMGTIVSRSVMEVRDFIRSGDYGLDADPTKIPGGLVNDLISIARWRFLISVPQFKQLQTDERKALYTDALAKLNLIAAQKFGPEPPSGPNIPLPPGSAMWNSENKLLMRTHPVPQPGTQTQGASTDYANPNAPPDVGTPPP
jgi:hypothetical protein